MGQVYSSFIIMFQQTIPLSKKTKTQLLEEYRQLQGQFDQLKQTASMVHEPGNISTVEKASDFTQQRLTQSIHDMKTTASNMLRNLDQTFQETLNQLLGTLLLDVEKFDDLRKAIELSKENLNVHHHIEVAAESLTQIVFEYEAKKKELETASQRENQIIEEEIGAKKRDWQREKEEYEYQSKRSKQRDEERFAEERAQKEKELGDRQESLKMQEAEVIELRNQVSQFPAQLEKQLKQKEADITRLLDEGWKQKLDALTREWKTDKQILDAQAVALKDHIQKQQSEIVLLRQEAERANKKAQELAVKVIEHMDSSSAKIQRQPKSFVSDES